MNQRKLSIQSFPEDEDGSFPAARLGENECVNAIVATE
jgi:hypothetical protein